jgi:hypothetical protein
MSNGHVVSRNYAGDYTQARSEQADIPLNRVVSHQSSLNSESKSATAKGLPKGDKPTCPQA